MCLMSNKPISSLLSELRNMSRINFKRGHGFPHGPRFSARPKHKDPMAILDSLI
jgi:hypothetical protein